MNYTPPTEAEWKTLATEEITHLTDEEKERLPADWDRFIAQIRRDTLAGLAEELTESVSRIQSSDSPNPLDWQTGALWARDLTRIRRDALEAEAAEGNRVSVPSNGERPDEQEAL